MTAVSCRDCRSVCGDCPRPRVLSVNVPVVTAYLDCATQWRVGGTGLRTGLDYAGCRALLAGLRPRTTPRRLRALLKGLRTIEDAILRVQGEVLERMPKPEGAMDDE